MGIEPVGDSRFPRITLLFVSILVVPAATLIWLGLRLLEQDKAITAQRALERREAAADRAARVLEQFVVEIDRHLAAGTASEGAVWVRITASGVSIDPAGAAPWVPGPSLLAEADTRSFREAEVLEFRGDAEKALPAYEALAHSSRAPVRAGALLRLARVHRRAGRADAALMMYRQLGGVEKIAFEGMPADLLARRALCDLLAESRRPQELASESEALRVDLLGGKWTLDHTSWILAAEQAARWTGRTVAPSEEQILIADAAEWLWGLAERKDSTPETGSHVLMQGNAAATLLWHGSGDRVSAAVILQRLFREWTRRAAALVTELGSDLVIVTESGQALFGHKPDSPRGTVRRSTQDTGLPWTLLVTPAGDTSGGSGLRRGLIMLGLSAIVLFLAGGLSLLWWTLRRELAVARLQSDFVSAVSHEFRTPLTSIRHVTELLDESDDIPRERRKAFYAALGRSTGRLHRLVESLLDFARMEGGRRPYDLRPIDAREAADRVVAEFRGEVEPKGFTVELAAPAAPVPIRADAEALGHVLWNLLDNAVKYSGDSRRVVVSVNRSPAGVVIAVKDEGLGIPASEKKQIFGKFVRGGEARRRGIQGTGIGLALANHIVAGHHGKIELESTVGRGSTFSVVLPLGD